MTPARVGLNVAPDREVVTLDPGKIWFQDEEYSATKQREWLDRYTREIQA